VLRGPASWVVGLYWDRLYAGTAPVSFQSGKMHRVHLRRGCNQWLRAAVYLWADQSRHFCAWAAAYYRQKKKQGMSHAAALRYLGQRWLKTLWRMEQNRTPYDEALHLPHQVAHGSWVIALVPGQAPGSTPCKG
jgi:hypothetical protein